MASAVEGSAVSGIVMFAGLSEVETAAAARHLRKVMLPPEQVLLRQGGSSDTVYILVAGELDVSSEGPDGERPVSTLGAGAILGHLGVLVDEPRSATIVARTEAELWEIDRASLEAAVESGEVWAGRFLLATARQLAVLLTAVSREVAALAQQDAPRHAGPDTRVVELEQLRKRLFSQWAF